MRECFYREVKLQEFAYVCYNEKNVERWCLICICPNQNTVLFGSVPSFSG